MTEARRLTQRDAWVRTKAIETGQRLARDLLTSSLILSQIANIETRWKAILCDVFVECYEQGREEAMK